VSDLPPISDAGDGAYYSGALVRIARNMVKAGTAFCIAGNHDVKLVRWLRGKQVQVKHGLEQSIAEIESLGRKPSDLPKVVTS